MTNFGAGHAVERSPGSDGSQIVTTLADDDSTHLRVMMMMIPLFICTFYLITKRRLTIFKCEKVRLIEFSQTKTILACS